MKKILLFIFLNLTYFANSQVSDFKNINFKKVENIVKTYKNERLNNLPQLSFKLTSKLTSDVEKFRAIYLWVTSNIKGDYTLSRKIIRKRKRLKNDSIALYNWNKSITSKVFKTLREKQKTMCTGYAYLIKELASLSNIECKIINGYNRTSTSNVNSFELINHSWNAVKLNNKWYLCDPSLSSGYTNEFYTFIFDYNDGYFLTEPSLFSKNHYPQNKKWLLGSNISKQDFITSPLIYDDAFKYKITPITPSKMNIEIKKGEEVTFKFKALKKITTKNIALVSYIGVNEKHHKIYNLRNVDNIITFKFKVNKKRNYDLHLKIDNDVVMTYTMKLVR